MRGPDAVDRERREVPLDVHVVRLRKKLSPYGDLSETVTGLGYRIAGPRAVSQRRALPVAG